MSNLIQMAIAAKCVMKQLEDHKKSNMTIEEVMTILKNKQSKERNADNDNILPRC